MLTYASFFVPCDDATVDAAGQCDRAESRALRKAGDYDRVAKMPAVRVHGCALPAATRGLGGVKGVLPPRVPAGPDECEAQRAPVAVHRYLDVTMYYVLHFSLVRGVLGIFRIGWIRHLQWYITLSGSLAWMLPLMPNFATCLAAVGLLSGSTLPSLAVLSWSSGGRLVRLGVVPGGMVVLVSPAQGHVLLLT